MHDPGQHLLSRPSFTAPSLLLLLALAAHPAQAQFKIASGVFGSGNTVTTDGRYRLVGTFGQPLTGPSLNTTLALDSGFWSQPGIIVKMTLAQTYRIAVYVSGFDVFAPAPFHGLIKTKDQWIVTMLPGKLIQQQMQQHRTGVPGRPAVAVEHPMIVLKVYRLA